MIISNNKIKVFHLENNQVIRKMVQATLQVDNQVMLFGAMEYSDFHVRLLGFGNIDIVIMGLDKSGILPNALNDEYRVCHDIRKSLPDVKVIVHSVYNDALTIKKIMTSGIHGFISKLVKDWEIFEAIKAVCEGEKYICSQASQTLKNSHDYFIGHSDLPLKNDRIFTPREMDVLGLIGIGLSSKEIADSLYISLKTVETHRKSLIKKSSTRNTAQLIAFSSLHGYL